MSLPDFARLRAGNADCPSDLALDRLHARELPAESVVPLEAHVATCSSCEARMKQRTAGFDAVPDVDPRRLLAEIRTRAAQPEVVPLADRLVLWGRRLLAPLAVATAAALVLLVPRQQPAIRYKGSSTVLHVYKQQGEHSEAVISGAHFDSGDRLRFSVDLPTESLVSIVGVESSGALYTAWPLAQGASQSFGAGANIELPGAVSLDETRGREDLYLVTCPPATGAPHCASAGPGQRPVCQASCTLTPFAMEKG